MCLDGAHAFTCLSLSLSLVRAYGWPDAAWSRGQFSFELAPEGNVTLSQTFYGVTSNAGLRPTYAHPPPLSLSLLAHAPTHLHEHAHIYRAIYTYI
jgi:hypothetical protein